MHRDIRFVFSNMKFEKNSFLCHSASISGWAITTLYSFEERVNRCHVHVKYSLFSLLCNIVPRFPVSSCGLNFSAAFPKLKTDNKWSYKYACLSFYKKLMYFNLSGAMYGTQTGKRPWEKLPSSLYIGFNQIFMSWTKWYGSVFVSFSFKFDLLASQGLDSDSTLVEIHIFASTHWRRCTISPHLSFYYECNFYLCLQNQVPGLCCTK